MDDSFRFGDELGSLQPVHIWRPAVGLKAVVATDNIACGPGDRRRADGSRRQHRGSFPARPR